MMPAARVVVGLQRVVVVTLGSRNGLTAPQKCALFGIAGAAAAAPIVNPAGWGRQILFWQSAAREVQRQSTGVLRRRMGGSSGGETLLSCVDDDYGAINYTPVSHIRKT